MAKKRTSKSKKPNLPQATLDRARRQITEPDAADAEHAAETPPVVEAAPTQAPAPAEAAAPDEAPTPVEEQAAPAAEPVRPAAARKADEAIEARAARRRAERESRRPTRSAPRRRPTVTATRSRSKDEVDSSMYAQLLANPTKTVSNEELQGEYGHVLADIRNMFIVSVTLMVLMVFLAQVL